MLKDMQAAEQHDVDPSAVVVRILRSRGMR